MTGVLFFAVCGILLSIALPACIFRLGGFSPFAAYHEIRWQRSGTVDRIRRSGRLRAAWIGYSPISTESKSPAPQPDDQACKWAANISQRLGGPGTQWTSLTWEEAIPALVSWRVDLVIDPILASPERTGYARIIAYTRARDGILVFHKAEAHRFAAVRSLRDLDGRNVKVGVTRGTTDDILARRLPRANVVRLRGRFVQDNAHNMMSGTGRRLHAMLVDDIVAQRMQARYGAKLEKLVLDDGTERDAGIMIRAQDAQFAAIVAAAVAATKPAETTTLARAGLRLIK